jgi:hypothetical protein
VHSDVTYADSNSEGDSTSAWHGAIPSKRKLTVTFSRIKVDLLNPPRSTALQSDSHLHLRKLVGILQVVEQQLSRVLDQPSDLDGIVVEVAYGRDTSMVSDKVDVVRRDV